MTAHRKKIRIVFFITILATFVIRLPLPVLALPERELASSFESQVRPFFEEQFIPGSFKGVGGLTLRYAKREVPVQTLRGLNGVSNQRKTLVLVIGRTEFLPKYAELLYDLRDLPFSIYIFDHRGQGASDRLLPDHDKGHVGDFQDYVDDLSVFIDTVVIPESCPTPAGTEQSSRPVSIGIEQNQRQPLYMLTHSMGGTVAALYANSHPGMVQGMIFCAPMLAITTKPFPVFVARLLAQSATAMGFGASYVPGGKSYDPTKPFSRNDVTHSQARFSLNQSLVVATPVNALGSPTYGWVDQAFAGMERLAGDHRNLTMPVLLLQAGADTVVDKRRQSDFCSDLPDCTLVDMPRAKHEILMEEDSIRNRAILLIRDFLERQP